MQCRMAFGNFRVNLRYFSVRNLSHIDLDLRIRVLLPSGDDGACLCDMCGPSCTVDAGALARCIENSKSEQVI